MFKKKAHQSQAEWLFPKVFFVIVAIFVLGFAWQTWLLVDAFMPDDQLLMKALTVFAFDGCALLYFLGKQFYPFASHESRNAVQTMFTVSFVGSLLCTIIWMILHSARFNWALVPWWAVIAVSVLVTFAIAIHVLVFYYIIEKELEAGRQRRIPESVHADDLPLLPEQYNPNNKDPEYLAKVQMSQDMRDFLAWRDTRQSTNNASPLASPPLDTSKASQGTTNGNH